MMRCRSKVFLLTALPWKGIAAVGCTSHGSHFANPATWPHRWSYPSMKKRAAQTAPNDMRHLAAVESTIFSGLVPLIEHMAVKKYDDGDAREPGWITIKTTGAAWVVQVKDPDTSTSFSAVADTLDKALETAALLLSCDEAPWEADKWLADSAARRKKK